MAAVIVKTDLLGRQTLRELGSDMRKEKSHRGKGKGGEKEGKVKKKNRD